MKWFARIVLAALLISTCFIHIQVGGSDSILWLGPGDERLIEALGLAVLITAPCVPLIAGLTWLGLKAFDKER